MTPSGKLAIGLLLTAAAGAVDAVGFVELNGLYTSFMSGNTTQLGIHLGEGLLAALILPASLLFLFFLGSFAGSAIALASPRFGAVQVLSLAAALLAITIVLAMAGFPARQALLALAVATGMQNAALPPAGAARLGATYVTGTLFSAGQDLARAFFRQAPPWRFLQHLLVWLALLLGALLGGVLHLALGYVSLLAPLTVYLFCAGLSLRRSPG